MECRKFRIEGKVQGVWFRESTRQQALKLGISGYARNMPDGSVEVLACGDTRILDELDKWLRQGPPLAEVSDIQSELVKADEPDGFFTA